MHQANVQPSYLQINRTDNEIVRNENKRIFQLEQSNKRNPNDKSAL